MSLMDAFFDEGAVAASFPRTPNMAPKEVWLAIRSDGDGIGDGSKENPFAVNTPETFARVMRTKVDSYAIIHLGPGVFHTRGSGGDGYIMDADKRWFVRPGQKMVGSGMFSTTIRFTFDLTLSSTLSDNNTPGQRHYMVRSDPAAAFLDTFEISDLTFDCNLQNAPFNGMDFNGFKFSVTALATPGNNICYRRLRIINFGTRTPIMFDGVLQPPPSPGGPFNRSYEGFPSLLGGRSLTEASSNPVMEDCVIEQPYPGPAREVTFVVAGGPQTALGQPSMLHLQPFGSFLRNCYLNFDFINGRNGNPIAVKRVIYTPGSNRVWLETQFPHGVSAQSKDFVEVRGATNAAYNGRFPVKTPTLDKDVPNSRLLEIELPSDPGSGTSGNISMEQSFLPTLRISAASFSAGEIIVTTIGEHKRKLGDEVVISGANEADYNGTFVVKNTGLSSTSFRCNVSGSPATTATGELWLDRRPNATIKIIAIAIYGPVSNQIAQLTTVEPHFRKTGEWISILNVRTSSATPDPVNNCFNNYVEITEVIDRTTFRVKLPTQTNYSGPTLNTSIDPSFGTNYQASYHNGGFGGGVWRNRISSARKGGYHDFYFERHCIFARNYLHNVYFGGQMAMGSTYYVSGDPKPDSSFLDGTVQAPPSAGKVQVKLNTAGFNPNYPVGVALRISKAPGYTQFADVAVTKVETLPGDYFAFEFQQPASPSFSPTDIVRADIWFQQEFLWYENNVVDLALDPIGDLSVRPLGVTTLPPYWNTAPLPPTPNPYILDPVRGFNDGKHYPWTLRHGLLRDNYYRKVNGKADVQSYLTRAMALYSAENLIVQGNIIWDMNQNPNTSEYDRAHTIDYADVSGVKAFNNKFPSGQLIQMFNDPSWYGNVEYFLDEVETVADLVMIAI